MSQVCRLFFDSSMKALLSFHDGPIPASPAKLGFVIGEHDSENFAENAQFSGIALHAKRSLGLGAFAVPWRLALKGLLYRCHPEIRGSIALVAAGRAAFFAVKHQLLNMGLTGREEVV